MDTKQARELLVQATGLLKLDRAEHQAVSKALEVLKPKEEKEEEVVE